MSTQLLSVREVAGRLGVCENTVYGLIARGDLPTVDLQLGRAKTRVRETDLEKWIERRTRRIA